MFEYAAFGFVTLVWWTWPCLWAVVLVAVYGSQRLSAWRDRRIEQNQSLDVRPCLIHMGTTPDGREQWCWQQRGHDGPHLTQWGVPQEDFELEHEEAWEDEELVVPVSPGLCTWNEDGRENKSACWKMAGHPGPHMFLDQ